MLLYLVWPILGPFVILRPFASDVPIDFCKIYAQVDGNGWLNGPLRDKKFFTNDHVQD